MTKHSLAMQSCVWVILSVLFFAVSAKRSSAQSLCATGTVCVTTWQNDAYRTGNNLSESTITPSSITTDNFGKLCTANLDGQVFAQPLVVTNAGIDGQTHFVQAASFGRSRP